MSRRRRRSIRSPAKPGMSTKRPPPSVRQRPDSTFVEVIFAATGSAIAVKATDATAIVTAIFVRTMKSVTAPPRAKRAPATPPCKSLA